jgi:outer membrane lipoprotein-sorting protein
MRIFTNILIVFLFFSGQLIFAQAKKSSDDILKEVSEKTKSFSNIRIDFTYTMDNPSAKIHESYMGSILMKGDKYRASILGSPTEVMEAVGTIIPNITIISDNKLMWTYTREFNEVQINPVEEDKNDLSLNRLLTSYSEDYKSKLTGEVTKDGRVQYVIELKPNADKTFTIIELNIDKELLRITRIAMQDKSGNTFSYVVNKFEPNVSSVKDTDFIFDAKDYPGVEVIDMR